MKILYNFLIVISLLLLSFNLVFAANNYSVTNMGNSHNKGWMNVTENMTTYQYIITNSGIIVTGNGSYIGANLSANITGNWTPFISRLKDTNIDGNLTVNQYIVTTNGIIITSNNSNLSSDFKNVNVNGNENITGTLTVNNTNIFTELGLKLYTSIFTTTNESIWYHLLSIGNWSNDKTNYYNTTQTDILDRDWETYLYY